MPHIKFIGTAERRRYSGDYDFWDGKIAFVEDAFAQRVLEQFPNNFVVVPPDSDIEDIENLKPPDSMEEQMQKQEEYGDFVDDETPEDELAKQAAGIPGTSDAPGIVNKLHTDAGEADKTRRRAGRR